MIGARRSTNGGSAAEAGRRSLRAGRVLAGVSIAAMLVAGLLPNAAPAAASPIAAMVPGATVDSARLAQMMPRFVQQPKVKGRFLTFGVRVHPWRTSKRNTASKPDRMGGQVWISKPKTSLRGSSSTVHKARALGHPNRTIIMTHRTLPIRTITKDGVKTYRVKLPLKVARSLSGLSRAQLAKRVDVQMWNDKDILAGVPGSDLRQHASAFPPGTLPKAKKSSKQRGTGARSTAGRQSVRSAPMDNNNNGISTQKNTPGNLMIFNGSPFDMTYNVAELSCMSINNSTGALTTGTLSAGASAQYSMVGYPNGGDGTNYDSDAPTTGASAWNTIACKPLRISRPP